MALAAANFLWQLGSSSYYVDELISVNAASSGLGDIVNSVGVTEITPPGWFLFLHEWIGRVAHTRSEWVMRLPSAVCAVLLVAVVYRLARLLSERRAVAVGAAAICALSPFELEHAQRAQGYAALGLAVAVAFTAAITADREPERRSLWMGVCVAASVLALLLHYTAGLVIAPLCVWVLTRDCLSGRWRWGLSAACAGVELALLPLLLAQHQAHPARGVASSAALTPSSLLNMLEVPFSGRVNALRRPAAAVTLAALALVSLRTRFGGPGFSARRLVLAVAIGEPLVLIAVSAVGGRFWGLLMLTRYAAVAAPFMVVSIALAVEAAPRPAAGGLALAVAVLVLVGTLENHRRSSFYLDARGAAAYVRANARPGDVVLEPGYPLYELPLDYYGLHRLRPLPTSPQLLAALERGGQRRLWLLAGLPAGTDPSAAALLVQARRALAPSGYRPAAVRAFAATAPLVVVLATPIHR